VLLPPVVLDERSYQLFPFKAIVGISGSEASVLRTGTFTGVFELDGKFVLIYVFASQNVR